MDRRESAALDRHITGNYGEDQFKEDLDAERRYYDNESAWDPTECQVSNCREDAIDGVLCSDHCQQAEAAATITEDNR